MSPAANFVAREELSGIRPAVLEEDRREVAPALVCLLGETSEVARADGAHRVLIDRPPARCIDPIIPSGATPSGYRFKSSSNNASGSQPESE